MGDREAVPHLLSALASLEGQDRFLEHSLLFALIEIGDAEGMRSYQQSHGIRRATLLVLEQSGGGPYKGG